MDQLFEISVNVPWARKRVTLEVAPNHTAKSLVEEVASSLSLPKGSKYVLGSPRKSVDEKDFGTSLETLGITQGSKLRLLLELPVKYLRVQVGAPTVGKVTELRVRSDSSVDSIRENACESMMVAPKESWVLSWRGERLDPIDYIKTAEQLGIKDEDLLEMMPAPSRSPTAEDMRLKVLEYVRKHRSEQPTAKVVAASLGLPVDTTVRVLEELVREGKIKRL